VNLRSIPPLPHLPSHLQVFNLCGTYAPSHLYLLVVWSCARPLLALPSCSPGQPRATESLAASPTTELAVGLAVLLPQWTDMSRCLIYPSPPTRRHSWKWVRRCLGNGVKGHIGFNTSNPICGNLISLRKIALILVVLFFRAILELLEHSLSC
jgi:hypothetical protein